MSKRLQGNGLFESSRMMLPEHKEEYGRYRQRLSQKNRPDLDEQMRQHLSDTLGRALRTKARLAVTVFEGGEYRTVAGRIRKWDAQSGRLLVSSRQGDVSVRIVDIVDADIADEAND